MAELDFIDWDSIPETQERESLPVGNYTVIIADSDLKETKSQTGLRLELKYQVIEGDFKNRVIFENLNIKNDSEIAERIGQQKLKAIKTALNLGAVTDSKELHDKPFTIVIGNKKDGSGTEVKKHMAKAQSFSTKVETAMSKPTEGKAPWAK